MAKRSHAKRKKAAPKKAAAKKPARKKLFGLNFINNSNDRNNSSVVIFGAKAPKFKRRSKPKSKPQPGRGAR